MTIVGGRLQVKPFISLTNRYNVFQLAPLAEDAYKNFYAAKKRKGKRYWAKIQWAYLKEMLAEICKPIDGTFKRSDANMLNDVLKEAKFLEEDAVKVPTDEKKRRMQESLAWVAARNSMTPQQVSDNCDDEQFVSLYMQIRLRLIEQQISYLQAMHPTKEFTHRLQAEYNKIRAKIKHASGKALKKGKELVDRMSAPMTEQSKKRPNQHIAFRSRNVTYA